MKTQKVCGYCGYPLVEVNGCGCRANKDYYCRQCKKKIPIHRIKEVKVSN